jgi:hypothetical protein
VRSQYRFMELAREKAQAGPGIPGAGGGPYQVRTVAPPRGLPASGGGQAAAPATVAPAAAPSIVASSVAAAPPPSVALAAPPS